MISDIISDFHRIIWTGYCRGWGLQYNNGTISFTYIRKGKDGEWIKCKPIILPAELVRRLEIKIKKEMM